MAPNYHPNDMLTRKEMAHLMRISPREFSRRLSTGEIPPGRPYMGGYPRWPACLAYWLMYLDHTKERQEENDPSLGGQPLPTFAKSNKKAAGQ